MLNKVTAFVTNCFYYIFLKISLLECSYDEVKNNTYNHKTPLFPRIDHKKIPPHNTDILLKYVQDICSDTYRRRKDLEEKAKLLLTLNGAIITFMTTMSVKGQSWYFFPIIFMILSSLFVVKIYSIYTYQKVVLSENEIKNNNKNKLTNIFIESTIEATNNNSNVVDYTVDLYRAALRYFMIALITSIISSGIYFWQNISKENAFSLKEKMSETGHHMVSPTSKTLWYINSCHILFYDLKNKKFRYDKLNVLFNMPCQSDHLKYSEKQDM